MERASAACLLVEAVMAVTARAYTGLPAIGILCSSASDSHGTKANCPPDKHKRRGWPLICCAGILTPGALT
eukprot:SM000022S07146  [mRNA]  locus=s22:143165:143473:- [translate_table: standard]